jgi:hypothetical protein
MEYNRKAIGIYQGSRVYAATLHQTLFGDWQIQRTWGGKGRRGGHVLALLAYTGCRICERHAQGPAALVRRQRGNERRIAQ